MHSARVLHCPHHEDTFPRTRMMRVIDQDIELLFLGSMSWVRPAWANHGLPAHCHKACRDGFSVLYRRAPRLFADLATTRGEGRLARLIRSLERTRLLIIDNWGPEPLNAEQRRDLLEIVDDREGKGSLLITSQVPIGRWHEIIGDSKTS